MRISKWLLSRIAGVIVFGLFSGVTVWCTYSDNPVVSIIRGVVIFIIPIVISLAWGFFDRKVRFYW